MKPAGSITMQFFIHTWGMKVPQNITNRHFLFYNIFKQANRYLVMLSRRLYHKPHWFKVLKLLCVLSQRADILLTNGTHQIKLLWTWGKKQRIWSLNGSVRKWSPCGQGNSSLEGQERADYPPNPLQNFVWTLETRN